MAHAELVTAVTSGLSLDADLLITAKQISLEELLIEVPFGNAEVVKLFPFQRRMLFYPTRDKNLNQFQEVGLVTSPGDDHLTHDIRSAANDKWTRGIITVWNPLPSMISPEDETRLKLVSQVPSNLVGKHMAETDDIKAFDVDKSFVYMGSEYFLAAYSTNHYEIHRMYGLLAKPDFLKQFNSFSEMIEELVSILKKTGKWESIYQNPEASLDLNDLFLAAAVKMYESQLKFEAKLAQHDGLTDRLDRIPDFGIEPYAIYKKIKKQLPKE